MSDILIFVEHENGKVKKSTHELLSKATELAQSTGGTVSAVALGTALDGLTSDLASYGAKKVALVEDAKLAAYNTIAYTTALATVIENLKPGIVLGTASSMGKDLFPRLSARIKAGFAQDCVGLRIDGGKLVAKKPIFAGKALVEITYISAVQMATIRANSFAVNAPQAGATAEVFKLTAPAGDLINPLIEVIKGTGGDKVDLTEAETIVSGGRGLASKENFRILEDLANVLGATVGASRAAVDSGYASHDMQVGQTGKVVNPKLYIATGISGAIQHLAGMRTSKVIVAINKDPEAPIFAKADYGVVGDLFKVVPLLTESLKKLLTV
ncbi:MAG TPA: electron transfer flavoprotein subunit alpha/FixB family protein [bacterium]|nr:electron transfer flavoprotein subunit alpha/FixB family protein [bacterium]